MRVHYDTNIQQSEKEVRVVNLWSRIPQHAEIKTECISGTIRQVMKFDMEKRCTEVGLTFDEIFDGIILGPKSEQSISCLQKYVKECGFSELADKIYKSDCPLR